MSQDPPEETSFVLLPQPPIGRFGGGRFGENASTNSGYYRMLVHVALSGTTGTLHLSLPAPVAPPAPVHSGKKPGLAEQFQPDWRKKKPARR